MRRNDAMWRQSSLRLSNRKVKPTVEGVEKRLLLTTFTVRNTDDNVMTPSVGSLRYEIMQSNLTPGANTIVFNIAASGVQTINVMAALPQITVPVTIDGTTERGYSGTPIIELNGSSVGKGIDGLDISAGNSTIKGLTIDGFTGEGINLSVAGGNTIASNFIGTNPAGTTAVANGLDGILVQASSDTNTISGNVISGNTVNGIYLNGQAGGSSTSTTSGNIITGNFIGTDLTGKLQLGNQGDGIYVQNAPQTTVGGTTAAARNIISANANGLELFDNSDTSVIEGNYIGTDVTGTMPLGNTLNNLFGDGIVLRGISNSVIGGTAAGAGNVISGNHHGINSFVIGSTNISIEGNFIGTDATGTAAVANSVAGIDISGETNVTIGGTAAGARNVISGNLGDGITTFANGPGLLIQGNYIGTDLTGTLPLGNGGDGINATYDGITIGGTAAGAGNIIANNGATATFDHDGVAVTGNTTPILSNSIYNNANLGINLNGSGNNNQAAPVLTSAVSMDTTSTFVGTLTTPVDDSYTLQFFSTPTLNAAGNAEGKTFIGSGQVRVNGGTASFTLVLPSGFTPGSLVTATATDSTGNTSEFSNSVIGTGSGNGTKPPLVTVVASAPTVFAGQNVTDTFTISNTTAVANLGVALSDAIPAGTSFFSGTTSTGAPVVVTNGVANTSLGTLNGGQSVTVTIVLTTLGGSVPAFTNVGSVTATTPTVTPGSDTASVTTNVTASADLTVAINGPLTPVPVGGNITYQVTVGDNGPSDATGVVLTDTLPANTTFVSATASAGPAPTESGGVVTDSIGPLANGNLVLVTITVATIGATAPTVTDSANVAGNENDSDPTNNNASVSTSVTPAADLAFISETASPASVVAGQPVTLTINVVNNGLSPATGVVVSDQLPAGLTFVSGTSAGGTVTSSNGLVTAPVGTLQANEPAVVTIIATATGAGTVTDQTTVSSSVPDPNPNNNSGSASVTVTAQSDVSVVLSGPTGPFNTGNLLTYTAVVSNSGPSPATNVVFTDPLFPGATFQSVTANGGIGTDVNGVATLNLGTIAAGSSDTVLLTVIPTQTGVFTNTAMVTATEPDPNPANNSSSVTTTLILPQPIIEFASPTFMARETDGTATITLDRIGDTSGVLTVHFSTIAGGNATPGLDYVPVSTIVTFPAGATQATVTVPVLPDPYDRVDEFVNLQIDTPTGGAIFANNATSNSAALQIINVDPVLVGPTISDLKLIGPVNRITGIEVDTSGNLNPTTAMNTANYSILAIGGGKGTLATGTSISVATAVYNAATGSVLLTPSTPLPANQFFLIDINGTRSGGVTDRAGNSINSVYGSIPGSDYLLTVARGTNLAYNDENGTGVTLKLTGPGTIDVDRTISGQVGRLQVLGPVAKKTVVTGSVHPSGRRTTIGTILGLGQFGSVATKLYTPPFYLGTAVYPNPANLNATPAVDTLLRSTSTSKTSTKSTKQTVKAKAITPTAKTAHAAQAHATRTHHAR